MVWDICNIYKLRFLTGVPQLEQRGEEKWGQQEKYLNYKKRTGILLPKFK